MALLDFLLSAWEVPPAYSERVQRQIEIEKVHFARAFRWERHPGIGVRDSNFDTSQEIVYM